MGEEELVSRLEISEREIRGNAAKYWSYREAWTRIKQALEQGFYLEAVTIEESIISDRLMSYLVSVGTGEQVGTSGQHLSFGKLIQLWGQQCLLSESQEGCTLQLQVDQWRQPRNKVVHGIVKLSNEAPRNTIIQFVEEAKQAAEEGERLARAVSNWVKHYQAAQRDTH